MTEVPQPKEKTNEQDGEQMNKGEMTFSTPQELKAYVDELINAHQGGEIPPNKQPTFWNELF